MDCRKVMKLGTWESLTADLQDNVLNRLDFKNLLCLKLLSKSYKEHIESDAYGQWRGLTSSQEGSFTAINYYVRNNAWCCIGFDLHSKTWRTLPSFSPILPVPTRDSLFFKECFICGHGGLVCANAAKLPKKGEFVIFNPLTRKRRELPPLIYPRSPVLVHMLVNSTTKSYKVIAIGSSLAMDVHLSRKIEVFDSKTSKWEEASHLPGPVFGLNDFQTGVHLKGILYFTSSSGGYSYGIEAFDVENKKCLDNMRCHIPFSQSSKTLQLVKTLGKVYLFSEQDQIRSVMHCIDVLESSNPKAGEVREYYWRNVVQVEKSGGSRLHMYPEYTCVRFGPGKLCILNCLNRKGVVYDMRDGRQCGVLEPPPVGRKGDIAFTLTPSSFMLKPSFDSDPMQKQLI